MTFLEDSSKFFSDFACQIKNKVPGANYETVISPQNMPIWSRENIKRNLKPRNGDIIIADKGYTSYENYEKAFTLYKVIPLIFPRKNMDISKILSVSYPVDIFSQKAPLEKTKQFFEDLHKKFAELLPKWKDFRPLGGRIEGVFKLLKEGFFREKYTDIREIMLQVCTSGCTFSRGNH